MITGQKFVVLFGLILALTGCTSAYYATLEKVGIPKRKLMVTRVAAAQSSQEEAKEQFKSALDRFSAVVKVNGEPLQSRYSKLAAELEGAERKATDVSKRIDAVASVSEALFEEWTDELDQYTNPKLRAASERSLRSARERYQRMISAMRRAESRLEPVLRPLRDNVLFLKHNLNAEAIGSLDAELLNVESNVENLLRELERSITESSAFVAELGKS